MCKNFILTKTDNLSEDQFLKLRRVTANILTSLADKDGFGYAAINGDTGSVFGERFVDVSNINFQLAPDIASPTEIKAVAPTTLTKAPDGMPESYAPFFDVEVSITPAVKPSNYFGRYSKPRGAFLAHARMSTNEINIQNTHPHRTPNWTLIHNGMVSNEGDNKAWLTTCDSEYLVHYLTVGGVNNMVSSVSGYYAVAAIEHTTQRLLIVKDARADLYGIYCADIDAMAISTSKTQLDEIVKQMGFLTDGVIRPLKNNTAWLYEANGALVSVNAIEPTVKVVAPAAAYNMDHWRSSYKKRNKNKQPRRDSYGAFSDDDFNRFYIFKDSQLNKISFQRFLGMSLRERENCMIIDKDTNIDVTETFFWEHPYVS